MSAIADAVGAPADDRLARRNAFVLAVAQALAGGNNTVTIALGGIVGAMLASDKGLATVPVTLYVLGMWIGTLPFGFLARRFGRRTAFLIGTVFGVLTGLLSCIAVLHASFAIYNVGALFSGFYAAAHQGYRFAAADTASDAFKPKAISWVMIGGLVAGIVGPQMVIATKELWLPYLFAATFIAQAGLAAISALVLLFVNIPTPPSAAAAGAGRPLAEIVRQPRFVVAVAVGVASYSMMNLVMTSAPLAMLACAHSVTDATLGIQWHVIGMFAPSFFTGGLITRFGAARIAAIGLVLIVASAVISISGITLWHFWTGLVFLGVGWNFGFIGATTLVTQCHRPNERNRVQSFNDFLVFGSLAIASFASGKLLEGFGWAAVNQVVFPVVLAALALLAWMSIRARPPAVPAA
jgi:predicted MFS family arabinose efflux permease